MSLTLTSQQKALYDGLGSDWFLLFLQPHLHASTLKLGLVLLTQFLSSPHQQRSFREGVLPATLVDSMEEPSALTGTLTIRILYQLSQIHGLFDVSLLITENVLILLRVEHDQSLAFDYLTVKSSCQTTSKPTPGPLSAPAPLVQVLTFFRVC